MSSTAGRKFMEELSNLLQKHVSIVTSQGKTYVGTLTGVDTEHLSVCLTNAKGEQATFTSSSLTAALFFRFQVSRNRSISRVWERGLSGSFPGWFGSWTMLELFL